MDAGCGRRSVVPVHVFGNNFGNNRPQEVPMSWELTHRRWAALREVAATADVVRDGELPWKDEYAELFGDRDGLAAALRYRHDLATSAQLDPDLPIDAYQERARLLLERTREVRRVLTRYATRREAREEMACASA